MTDTVSYDQGRGEGQSQVSPENRQPGLLSPSSQTLQMEEAAQGPRDRAQAQSLRENRRRAGRLHPRHPQPHPHRGPHT